MREEWIKSCSEILRALGASSNIAWGLAWMVVRDVPKLEDPSTLLSAKLYAKRGKRNDNPRHCSPALQTASYLVPASASVLTASVEVYTYYQLPLRLEI